jgi:hypothetical protein
MTDPLTGRMSISVLQHIMSALCFVISRSIITILLYQIATIQRTSAIAACPNSLDTELEASLDDEIFEILVEVKIHILVLWLIATCYNLVSGYFVLLP